MLDRRADGARHHADARRVGRDGRRARTGKVYTVRAGDKLADGVIRQVNATSVVILQEVNDPLSLEKQREVRKFLRGGDEVK